MAGFWSSFFRSGAPRDVIHSVHGITATLWLVLLAGQSFLMSKGLVPVVLISAVHIVRFMTGQATIPTPIGPMLALFNLPAVTCMAIFFALGLANVRRPAAHQRFMAATVLPALSPALARLFQTRGSPSLFVALHVVLVPVGTSPCGVH